ncbi:hypothetical protein SBC1_70260 (plasmid) [Caballeronia sp. SBC1]|nr:hypothetical protein SBC2_70000 [Caballeronia sp. SBC2]QIN66979.1 hypothetical protein SBC1_70260 [Caballeronia sp. SBC1]
MLSHHEIPALLSIGDREPAVRTLAPEVLALRHRRLLKVNRRDNGTMIVRLTDSGRELVGRVRSAVARENTSE